MKLSIYTFVKDGIFFDYHIKEMLRHHLPLADEIIVNEGYSSDGTYEAISNIDPKIKIFRMNWSMPNDIGWFVRFKDAARLRCTGDWCILLDCDEFIPEWEFEKIRMYLESTTEAIIPMQAINFYGNFKVYNARPEKVHWPSLQMKIHRNFKEIEIIGDGSNVRLKDIGYKKIDSGTAKFTYHHFGFVRNPARLRQKWRDIESFCQLIRKDKNTKFLLPLPSFFYNLFPHNWKDPMFLANLAIYEGPYIQAVRDNPDEFVRDGFALYEYLKKKSQERL